MSPYSSSGEVFGAKVLYAAMVAVSALVLFAAVASTLPGARPGAPAQFQTEAQTQIGSAQTGKVS